MCDARFALDNFQYQLAEPRPGKKELNPYNSLGARKKTPLPPPGVMTYMEAYKILKTKTYTLDCIQLQPFLIVTQKFGTTLPTSLRKKGITNDQIHTIVKGASTSAFFIYPVLLPRPLLFILAQYILRLYEVHAACSSILLSQTLTMHGYIITR